MINIVVFTKDKIYKGRMNEIIRLRLNKNNVIYSIFNYSSEIEFFSTQNQRKYDICILDIDRVENWKEIANSLQYTSKGVYLIIISDTIKHATEAFKFNAIRYLIKSESGFAEALDEGITSSLEKINNVSQIIKMKFLEGEKKINKNTIIYLESSLHKVYFHFREQKKVYTRYDKISNIKEKLDLNEFVRVHESYLINLNCIRYYKRYDVTLESGMKIPIAKNRYKFVVNTFIESNLEIEKEHI